METWAAAADVAQKITITTILIFTIMAGYFRLFYWRWQRDSDVIERDKRIAELVAEKKEEVEKAIRREEKLEGEILSLRDAVLTTTESGQIIAAAVAQASARRRRP